MEITIALGQMAVIPGDSAANRATAAQLAAQASAGGATLLMLPELWPSGYDLEAARQGATPLEGGHFAFMADLAHRHSLYLLGTALETNPAGRPFNTAALFGPGGELVAAYRKAHLFPPMGETEQMTAGSRLSTVDMPWGRTALAICYDLRFPEMWRRYMEAGAEICLIPAEWPSRRAEHWRLLLRARAIENQYFVVGCNRSGAASDGEFPGRSAAVDPWGRLLVEGEEEPGLLLTRVDLAQVARCRTMFPWLQDRRLDLYG